MSPTLPELETMARKAGAILLEGFSARPGIEGKVQVKYKGEIDLVTEMDLRAEALLIAEIRQGYPSHAINTEESGELHGDARCTWYIDPIDGTVNYAHGVPLFAVSLAYAEDNRVQLGVVYNPVADELFSAERGRGSWLNGAAAARQQRHHAHRKPAGHRLPLQYPHQPAQQPRAVLAVFAVITGRAPPGHCCRRPVLRGCRKGGWLLGDGDQSFRCGCRRPDCGGGRRSRHHRVRRPGHPDPAELDPCGKPGDLLAACCR